MGNLIQNIVSEVDSSREQMFTILESIAVAESNKDTKKFSTNQKKKKKQSYKGYSGKAKQHQIV
jgi:hypothetical protein